MAKRSRRQTKEDRVKERQKRLDGAIRTSWGDFAGQEEVDLESLPRRFKEEDSEDEALPVIVDGQVHKVKRQKTTAAAAKAEESDSASESSDSDDDIHATAQAEPEEPELTEHEVREKVAEYAELLNEEPEEHVGKLRDLQRLLLHSKRARTRQVLIFSLLTLYKDLIPGYHIRPLTEAQAKEKVSKDVRKLRDFEQQFVSYYRGFIEILENSYAQGRTETAGKRYGLASTALYAACELLERAPWFNFRLELIRLVVGKLASQRIDKPYLQCISTLEKLFAEDDEGHVSFEAVQALAKMIKVRRYKVDSRVMGVFIHLRLLTELVGRGDLERVIKEKPQGELVRKKDRVHLTKKQRKQRKEQKEIDEEMRKAETAVSAEMREKLQAQTLKLVFVLYFNILKERSKTLMSSTLEGIARFAHLVNAELFGDLLEVLREVISEQKRVNTRESLLCIVTAFALLSGQVGDSVNLDLTFFINHFYRILFDMAFDPHIEQSHKHLESSHRGRLSSETDMMIKSLDALFLKRSMGSRTRVLAFSKRLAMCALYFPERTALVALNVLDQMAKKHPQAKALFSTVDRVSRGVYHLEADVPEHANAEVATVWETVLLAKHYNKNVAKLATTLNNLKD